MKIRVDDLRKAPEGYVHFKSVSGAISFIKAMDSGGMSIEVLDMDHDAGLFAKYGGDYIEILKWMEENGKCYPIHIHSMNPVGIENMRRIINRNGWKEI